MGSSAKLSDQIETGKWNRGITVPYNGPEGSFNVSIAVFFPTGYIAEKESPALILLHPYGRIGSDWERFSSVKKLAEDNKIVLICPDMGKTVFENEFFPESAVRWQALPGGVWIRSTLIPFLQKQYRLCTKQKLTGIAGIEIGARGALLSAAQNPSIFGFAGGISGLYDSASVDSSSIFTGAYGPYRTQKTRWESADSIITLAPGLEKVQIYLSHGKNEKSIPLGQSQLLAIRLSQLKKQNPGRFAYQFDIIGRGDGGWGTWNAAIPVLFSKFVSFTTAIENE